LNNLIEKDSYIKNSKLKPINFYCRYQKETEDGVYNYSSTKPTLHGTETLITTSIEPTAFVKENGFNPLNQTNEKWFINLSKTAIPNEASSLLQFGSNFCIPHTNNKKSEIHEVIKDIESNISKFNTQHKADIIIPQLQRFLDARTNNNVIDLVYTVK
jgi:hypothetical protein